MKFIKIDCNKFINPDYILSIESEYVNGKYLEDSTVITTRFGDTIIIPAAIYTVINNINAQLGNLHESQLWKK